MTPEVWYPCDEYLNAIHKCFSNENLQAFSIRTKANQSGVNFVAESQAEQLMWTDGIKSLIKGRKYVLKPGFLSLYFRISIQKPSNEQSIWRRRWFFDENENENKFGSV